MNTLTEQELLNDKGYPGFSQDLISNQVFFGPMEVLSEADLEKYWVMEYRWPNGMCPLGMTYFEIGLTRSIQYAAEIAPLPPSNGFDFRLVGTSVYGTEREIDCDFNFVSRDFRFAQRMPGYVENFKNIWQQDSAAILHAARHMESQSFEGKTLAELDASLTDVTQYIRWVWERHFEHMYLLLLNHSGFYFLGEALGLDRAELSIMFGGQKTKIGEGDEAIWKLTRQAQKAGVANLILANETDPQAIRAGLLQGNVTAQTFNAKIDEFLAEWGWRTGTMVDPLSKSWVEDPTPLFGHLAQNLRNSEPFSLDAKLAHAKATSEAAIERARRQLSTREREQFNLALEANQKASFVWWNEDHNFYIDQRTGIPLRNIALAIGKALDLEEPEDVCFLFRPEIRQVLRREKKWQDFSAMVQDRKDYFEHWKNLRLKMPKFIGTAPESFLDPILTELDGLSSEYLARLAEGAVEKKLKGVTASPGVAEGRIRIVKNADELHTIENGEILVCEGTSPSWTAAFTRISACLTDQGGTLSHAAIVSREYGLPCVVALGKATTVFKDGDLVRVDGNNGIVHLIDL